MWWPTREAKPYPEISRLDAILIGQDEMMAALARIEAAFLAMNSRLTALEIRMDAIERARAPMIGEEPVRRMDGSYVGGPDGAYV